MSWFPIFGAGFLAGWWMCAATWPRDRHPDLRRSFNHENTAPNSSEERPLKWRQRTVRLDEGRVQRSNRSGAGYQPKPQIDPKGQRRTPNPPPSDL